MIDVALVTCANLPEPDFDAEPLCRSFEAAGIEAEIRAWDDPAASWSDAGISVLRSCWNYPRQVDRFLAWAERTARVTALWNPVEVVRWNVHKGYLLELERAGVPVTPTVLVRRGAEPGLGALMAGRGWERAVVKPAVSAASWRTIRVDRATADEGDRHLREITRERDALVQPYLQSVEGHGERALVWIDGELTHAVRKSPRFAGGDESVSEAVAISPSEADVAEQAVAAVGRPLLYARIDVAPGPGGSPCVMELELIEPSLFFPQCPDACERFVRAVRRRL